MIPRRPQLEDLTVVALLVAVLGASWTDMVLGIDPTPVPTENRALSPLPPWPSRPGDVSGFMTGFADYFYDNFGFRRLLLSWNRDIRLALGESPSARVVIGRDAWLFQAGAGMRDDYLGLHRMTGGELDAWQSTLAGRHHLAQAAGRRYAFIVAPDKMSVYPEYLPGSMAVVSGQRTLWQITARLEGPAARCFMPLVDDLVAAKADGLLYYRTDTHWTQRGAQAADAAIARRMGLPEPGPSAITARVIQTRGGDLARMLDGPPAFAEQISVAQPADVRPAAGEDLHLEWNSPSLGRPVNVVAVRFYGSGETTVLVFGDSFGRDLAPYLASRVAWLVYVPMHPDDESFAVLVDKFRPELVLEERTERFLKFPPRATPFADRKKGWMATE